MHDLDGHELSPLEVAREIYGGHAPTPELAFQRVAIPQGLRQQLPDLAHRFITLP
jgi:hypothetical protein